MCNPITIFIHAYSFRKWSVIARSHDLILTQNSNGRFSCFDVEEKDIISSAATAREAVQDALMIESASRQNYGV